MSTDSPIRGHRHTRSAAIPSPAASSQNPRNPHHLNQHAHARNAQPEMKNYNSDGVLPPSTPPRTPRKDNLPQNQPTPTFSGTGSKQKSRNKNRPKNVNTSPIATRNDRNISPLPGTKSAGIPSAKPMNTPSATAYAGPTFHASPAPSALPIPSFYSKSVPDSPGVKGLKSLRGAPTPPHATPAPNQFQKEESPLDIFFKADREEKARAQSANQAPSAAGPFQPPLESPRNSRTPPTPSSQAQPRQASGNRMSAGGIFAMELDGEREAGTPYGPAFSTPYSERISAARHQLNKPLEQPNLGTPKATDRSEALKNYLFSGSSLPPPKPEEAPQATSHATFATNGYQSAPPISTGPRSAGFPQRPLYNGYQYSPDPKHQNNASRVPGRSSGLRQEVTPTKTPSRTQDRPGTYSNSATPTHIYGNPSLSDTRQVNDDFNHGTSASSFGALSGNRNPDLQGIEDSLRKILKLDSAGSSGVTNSIGSQPAAAVSVPNYVGGRDPPMNGMHNGVMGS
ncbi:uncharacterized protein PAC_09889 [Phialocephala subalpina]|uniref:Uncharacterized protein n=1 Tax=Phialocephala subalpina TaxID=576137 RepID=A0A1L7X4P1_9HELO|nr:uncharacterized protein PAC_09889 [Phialocephala subalpina]